MSVALNNLPENIPDRSSSKKALGLLTAVNYLSYIDRFMLSALLSSIQKDLQLSDLQGGLLATAFMLAYVITSPVFGWLVQMFKRTSLLAIGVALWSLASLVTGIAGVFSMMIIARFMLGIGESIFSTVASPLLTDFFTTEKRARAFSVFASAAPAGAALGYILGGILGSAIGWRHSFFIAGIPGFILAYLIFKIREPRGEAPLVKFNVIDSFVVLKNNRAFVSAVLGYTAYTFVVGGLAHWMPSYIQRSFLLDPAKSNMIFGAVAVLSGFTGTLLGGFWSGTLKNKRQVSYLSFSACCMLAVVPCFVACFCATNLSWFIFFMVLTQFFFFMPTSPINVLIMESVPSELQTMAMAISIFACHIFGDAISSPLIGWISDRSGSLRIGMIWCAPVVFLSAVIWFFGTKNNFLKALKS